MNIDLEVIRKENLIKSFNKKKTWERFGMHSHVCIISLDFIAMEEITIIPNPRN
jgi:hypothetical protein